MQITGGLFNISKKVYLLRLSERAAAPGGTGLGQPKGERREGVGH